MSALLGKAPPANDHITAAFTANDGASFLMGPESAQGMRFYAQDDVFTISKNAAGELSLATLECDAANEVECRLRFLRGITPILDRIAYMANVPLFIQFVRVIDTKNEITSVEYVSPYRKAVIEPHYGSFPNEMQPIYAMHREAKNASSDFYRFLCLYKILEGLLSSMRTDVYARAKKAGVRLVNRKLTVPDDAEIAPDLRKYVGRSLKEFFDHVLTAQFRDGVAHFIQDKGSVLNMSNPEHTDTYAALILVCELCVRELVANHEALLLQIAS